MFGRPADPVTSLWGDTLQPGENKKSKSVKNKK
jgi:hypothetical protein